MGITTTIAGALIATATLIGASSAVGADPRDLPRSNPEAQGISSADLLTFIDAADTQIDSMNSFMLIRHGHVVAEGWWAPYDSQTRHALYSLTKSFTSTAVGLAVAEGKLSLDDPVIKFFPEDVPAEPSDNLKNMRVRDLLRMNTGHLKEPRFEEGDDWTRKFLAAPVDLRPGTHFLYNSAGSHMLSAIVQKVSGQTERDYLQVRLFEPLGIEDPSWGLSPQGVSFGGWGMAVRTEDIAKFGLMYLQHGRYADRQILPRAWVAEATSLQTSNGSSPTSDWDQGYGYQFWRCRHNFYRGDGAFGQFCIVMPEYDVVIAITSGTRDMSSVMNLVWDKILPAMKSDPLLEDPAAQQKLKAKLSHLAIKLVEGKPTSPIRSNVSGKVYQFPKNDKDIEAVSFDFSASSPVMTIKTKDEETQTPIAFGSWPKATPLLSHASAGSKETPASPLVSAVGAWTSDDTFVVRLVFCETPKYTTTTFRFDGHKLTMSSAQNVGPTTQPTLEGDAKPSP